MCEDEHRRSAVGDKRDECSVRHAGRWVSFTRADDVGCDCVCIIDVAETFTQMTETPVKKKRTSSTSKPRSKTLPSMNSSDSTTNVSNGSGNAKPKSSAVSAKTSSLEASTSKPKKGGPHKGKFAFQAKPTSRPKSQPSVSDEVTAQERLFSLADLKELAQIVRESPAGVESNAAMSTSTARTTPPSRQAKKTISKTKGSVTFKKKNGQHVAFEGRKKSFAKKVEKAPAPVPLPPADEELDMPSLAGYHNPYSYAFT